MRRSALALPAIRVEPSTKLRVVLSLSKDENAGSARRKNVPAAVAVARSATGARVGVRELREDLSV
jgi:hypothetical protein